MSADPTGTSTLIAWGAPPTEPQTASPDPPLQSLLDFDLSPVAQVAQQPPRANEHAPWTTSIVNGQTAAALLSSTSESPNISTSSAGKVLAAAQLHSRPSPGSHTRAGERSSLQASVTSLEGECNLIVAGLTREIDDEALKAMFSPFGTVMSSTVMRHVGTGVSRGFGFVLFAREQDGEAAIKAMHSSRCGPNVLNVHRSFHDGTIVETNAVFVRNLPLDVTNDRVANFFNTVGTATSITIASDTSKDAGDAPNGRRYKVATVIFSDVDTARDAVKMCHNKPFPVLDPTSEDPPLVIVKFAESAETRRTKRKTPNLSNANNARSSTSPTTGLGSQRSGTGASVPQQSWTPPTNHSMTATMTPPTHVAAMHQPPSNFSPPAGYATPPNSAPYMSIPMGQAPPPQFAFAPSGMQPPIMFATPQPTAAPHGSVGAAHFVSMPAAVGQDPNSMAGGYMYTGMPNQASPSYVQFQPMPYPQATNVMPSLSFQPHPGMMQHATPFMVQHQPPQLQPHGFAPAAPGPTFVWAGPQQASTPQWTTSFTSPPSQ